MFAKGVPLRRASRSLPGAVPRGPASHWGRASLTAHRGRFHPGLPSCATESLCESCFSRPIRPSRSMVVRRVRGASSLVRSDPRRRARDCGARPMRRRARTSGRTPDKQTRRWPLRISEQRFACYLRVCSSRVSCLQVVSSRWPSFPFQHKADQVFTSHHTQFALPPRRSAVRVVPNTNEHDQSHVRPSNSSAFGI